MKKRIALGLLGSICLLYATVGNVYGKTYGLDLGKEDGSSSLLITEGNGVSHYRVTENDTITEYGSIDEIQGLSEEEKKKLKDWHREEMREQIAYLEIYGVAYDGEADQILYQGKTVRCLIDRKIDNTCRVIQMPEGDIDLYTVRADDFRLTGVRIATLEEYEKNTEEGVSSSGLEVWAEDVAQEEERAAYWTEDECTATEGYIETKEEKEEWEKKVREYEQAGILIDNQSGSWLWEKKPIYMLVDENGSMYQNGAEEAIRNKIYVIVKRNSDGSISEAKQVTLEEVMMEQIRKDQR